MYDEVIWLVQFLPGGHHSLTYSLAVGVPLKATGESRINAQAKISLKAFDIVPKNSMALGVGITLRF